MQRRIERLKALVSNAPPIGLEWAMRSLLIHYFLHVSHASVLEIVLDEPEHPRKLRLFSPAVFRGVGQIRVASSVMFGWADGPGSYRCSYYEARSPESRIVLGSDSKVGSAAVLVSEGAGITIGQRCLIGTELQVFDTNAHELELGLRHLPDSKTRQVMVGNDVFIGSRVALLKGCQIGDGCVIAAGSVVPPGFVAPPMSIVAGNPAQVVGRVPTTPPSPVPAAAVPS